MGRFLGIGALKYGVIFLGDFFQLTKVKIFLPCSIGVSVDLGRQIYFSVIKRIGKPVKVSYPLFYNESESLEMTDDATMSVISASKVSSF